MICGSGVEYKARLMLVEMQAFITGINALINLLTLGSSMPFSF